MSDTGYQQFTANQAIYQLMDPSVLDDIDLWIVFGLVYKNTIKQVLFKASLRLISSIFKAGFNFKGLSKALLSSILFQAYANPTTLNNQQQMTN